MAFDFSFILETILLVYVLLGTIAAYGAYQILKRLVPRLEALLDARHADKVLGVRVRRPPMSPTPHRV